jgi:arylformamidase
MTTQWREMSDETLEASFNPRIASADAAGSLVRYATRSAEARALLAKESQAQEDLRYGPGATQTYDLYRPHGDAQGRPLVIFIHGGYWRALDKSDHSFVVPPLIAAGAVVVNLNYDLCPDVTLDVMCQQVIQGVRHCHANAAGWGADPNQTILIGHSAGAHLAARVLNATADEHGRPADLVCGVVAISGVYEPQVVLRIPTVNEQAQITADVAEQNDCLVRPVLGAPRLAVWAGGDEPEAWINQSRRYAEHAERHGLACTFFELPGTDHFTVLERSFEPTSNGWQAIASFLE